MSKQSKSWRLGHIFTVYSDLNKSFENLKRNADELMVDCKVSFPCYTNQCTKLVQYYYVLYNHVERPQSHQNESKYILYR